MADITHFHTKVVGVTFKNPDGSSRQRILTSCQVWEAVALVRGLNQDFPDSLAVVRENCSQIGYLGAQLAADLCGEIDTERTSFFGAISSLTGGTFEKPTRGVNLIVFRVRGRVDEAELEGYAQQCGRPVERSPDLPTPSEKPSALERYMGVLLTALEDQDLTSIELKKLQRLQVPLSASQILEVHTRIYDDLEADVQADGRVSAEEADQLTTLRVWLRELGFSPEARKPQ
jgi:hypothetical protein